MPSYTLRFDAATDARLAALAASIPEMATYYTGAMSACVQRVQQTASANAPVITGNLRRGIQGRVNSPFEGEVYVTDSVPYARRRELGFSGMTDSRGRYYPHDPGSYYMRRAFETEQVFIQNMFRATTNMIVQRFTTP